MRQWSDDNVRILGDLVEFVDISTKDADGRELNIMARFMGHSTNLLHDSLEKGDISTFIAGIPVAKHLLSTPKKRPTASVTGIFLKVVGGRGLCRI